MHFAGMLGMPRRIYTYDSGQGWDTFNMMSSIGAYLSSSACSIFAVQLLPERRSTAQIAGDNPWDAPTLEWSIPSPPPEYNFAQIPMVTSRYPLWDLTHPERTTRDPAHAGRPCDDAQQHTGEHVTARRRARAPTSRRCTSRREHKTAAELGIPMPNPTIKPLWVALGIVVMFSALLVAVTPARRVAFVDDRDRRGDDDRRFLYTWLTTPMESRITSGLRRIGDQHLTRATADPQSPIRLAANVIDVAAHVRTTTRRPVSITGRSRSGRSSGRSACSSPRSSRRT